MSARKLMMVQVRTRWCSCIEFAPVRFANANAVRNTEYRYGGDVVGWGDLQCNSADCLVLLLPRSKRDATDVFLLDLVDDG